MKRTPAGILETIARARKNRRSKAFIEGLIGRYRRAVEAEGAGRGLEVEGAAVVAEMEREKQEREASRSVEGGASAPEGAEVASEEIAPAVVTGEGTGAVRSAGEELELILAALGDARAVLGRRAKKGDLKAIRELRSIAALARQMDQDEFRCARPCCRLARRGPAAPVRIIERGGVEEATAIAEARARGEEPLLKEWPSEGVKG